MASQPLALFYGIRPITFKPVCRLPGIGDCDRCSGVETTSMANYFIKEDSPTILLMEERLMARIFMGAVLLPFGAMCGWLAIKGGGGYSGFGQAIFLGLGIAALAIGSLSLLRKGWIRVHSGTQRIEFYGGSRKFRSAPRVLWFREVKNILIRKISGKYVSYAVDLVVQKGHDVVLDQSTDLESMNTLASKVSQRIGCAIKSEFV